MSIVSNKEYCASDPNVAHKLYHCYDTDSKSKVTNNESLTYDHTGAYKRIMDHAERPCTSATFLKANKEAHRCSANKTSLDACIM